MRDLHIRPGQGFMLVYSVNSRLSFEAVISFRNRILRVKDDSSFPIILIGNKCDLTNDRQISTVRILANSTHTDQNLLVGRSRTS